MRVLLAPDKFKGTLTAAEVCRHLRAGILAAHPGAEVISHPLADGGEGTLDVLLSALGGERLALAATGPLGETRHPEVLRLPDGTIVIESARICGLDLVPPRARNPMRATTYGLGTVVAAVAAMEPSAIAVGLGGSATVDGGLGAARALGCRLIGEEGGTLEGCGEDLAKLRSIEPPASRGRSAAAPRLTVLCDVDNPLVGPAGAAEVFAAQKGASPLEVAALSLGLRNIASIIERDLGARVADLPGGGAAGGLGAMLHALCGGRLVPGPGALADWTGLDRSLSGADLVVTGEGAFDSTADRGKVVREVIRRAGRRRIPVVVVCGRWDGAEVPGSVRVVVGGNRVNEEILHAIGRTVL
ncbi:MAG: glycerate kinase [Acidobacteria bacterium]|nr:glycerate kinase [Acidobacteriota bacterium]